MRLLWLYAFNIHFHCFLFFIKNFNFINFLSCIHLPIEIWRIFKFNGKIDAHFWNWLGFCINVGKKWVSEVLKFSPLHVPEKGLLCLWLKVKQLWRLEVGTGRLIVWFSRAKFSWVFSVWDVEMYGIFRTWGKYPFSPYLFPCGIDL